MDAIAQDFNDDDPVIHREPGFVIEKSEKGCILFKEDIAGNKEKVGDFKSKNVALSYLRSEFS